MLKNYFYGYKNILICIILLFIFYLITLLFNYGRYIQIPEHILFGFILAEMGNKLYSHAKKSIKFLFLIIFVMIFSILWETLEFYGIAQMFIPNLTPEPTLFDSAFDVIMNYLGFFIWFYLASRKI